MSTKNTLIAIFAVLVLALIFGKGEEKPMAAWSYTEDGGAKEWAELDERYAMCAQGQNQSPINIVNPIDAKLEELKFESNSKATTFVNNGHAVQANFAGGTSLTIDGEKYALKQVHFHTPSENTINGKSFPMEAHFVHQKGKSSLAVVAVMFEKGEDNPVLNKLLRNLPEEAKASNALKSEIKGYELLPASKEYYRYNGSLTTPPCTEGVKWIVLKNPVSVSESQLKDFTNVMPKNNRPVQDLNARTVLN